MKTVHYQVLKYQNSATPNSATSNSTTLPSRHTTSFQRLYDVYTTSPMSYRCLIDVEMTSCVYWVKTSNSE